jgi:predicted esterase
MNRVIMWLAAGAAALALTSDAGARQPAASRPALWPPPLKIEAAPAAGFHHPYLLVLPPTIKAKAPVIVALPTPPTSADPADFLAAAERIVANAGPFLGALELPILVPVLPRPPVRTPEGTINLYLPALTREALLSKDASLARIDRQVLAMIDDARGRVKAGRGVQTRAEAVFIGFSAGGHFATRMAALHPERVLAVWAGGTGGHPVVPLAELKGRRLTYPVGIADLEQVSGRPFDAEAFAKVPMLIAQGSADRNTSLPSSEGPSDSYSKEQAQLVSELLGRTAPERLENVKKAYERAGCQAEFRVYHGVEHRISPEMARDIVRFIRRWTSSEGATAGGAPKP